MINNISNKI